MIRLLDSLFSRKKPGAPVLPPTAALFDKAAALHQEGKLDEARAVYESVLALDPHHADSLHMLGLIAAETGDLKAASDLIGRAVAIAPGNAAFHVNHANVLRDSGHLDAAAASFGKAVAIAPEDLQSWFHLGVLQQELKQFGPAVISLDKLIALNPGIPEAHYVRGAALRASGQLDAAIASYDKAISLNPGLVDAYFNRGNALKERKRLDIALRDYDKVISLQPDHFGAWLNRASVQSDLHQTEAALASYDAAIRLNAGFAETWHNRGNVLRDLGRLGEAVESYDKATSINPDYVGAQVNKGFAHLLNGNLAAGWPLYEWRWRKDEIAPDRRTFAQPVWDGEESLQGRTILLYAEQGFGDTIQFGRYAAAVKALGARVVMEVQPPVMTLMRGMPGVDQLVQRDSPLPPFDCHCALLSLPLAFKTTLDNMPPAQRYLAGEPAKLALWRDKLGARTKRRVGLVWSGSTGHTNDHNRSLRLETWLPHLHPLAGAFEFICLQKELRDADRQALKTSGIRFLGDEITDFTDTAALCELMDLVISVDTSVAHLAGALGRPTWVLLPFLPDWRWLMGRTDSPWYDSARLYRQGDDRQWPPVLARVAADLLQLPQ